MLLVIFGAGASYDSCSDFMGRTDIPGRIPMANELFAPRYNEFMRGRAAMRAIVPWLRFRNGENVERVLERLRAEGETYPKRSEQLMAVRLYLAAMLSSVEDAWIKDTGAVSNYRTLLDEINRLCPSEPVSFVTFNYDRMLERAIESDTSRRMSAVSDYMRPGERLNVYKVHGCVNWFRRVIAPRVPVAQLRNDVGRIAHAAEIELLDAFTSDAAEFAGEPYVPAIAVPLESKQDWECPTWHIEHLASIMPEISRILSIGWRATDWPFLQILQGARNVKRVDVVANADPAKPMRTSSTLSRWS
jgi:hypothetical protein